MLMMIVLLLWQSLLKRTLMNLDLGKCQQKNGRMARKMIEYALIVTLVDTLRKSVLRFMVFLNDFQTEEERKISAVPMSQTPLDIGNEKH